MENFKINKDDSANALLFTMIEVYGQNAVLLEMTAQLLSTQTNTPIAQIKTEFNEVLNRRKLEFQHILYANFGQLNQDDILPDK